MQVLVCICMYYFMPCRLLNSLGHSTANNPVIVGSFVHNIHIERLWRDTFFCVLLVFYHHFYYLEERGKLDPLSESDLYCLHFVQTPKIFKALDAFIQGWNNHAITTEGCKTPLQLFTSGTLTHGTQLHNFHQSVDSSILDADGVAVPNTNPPLSQSQEEELRSIVNPLQESSNYGIDL